MGGERWRGEVEGRGGVSKDKGMWRQPSAPQSASRGEGSGAERRGARGEGRTYSGLLAQTARALPLLVSRAVW